MKYRNKGRLYAPPGVYKHMQHATRQKKRRRELTIPEKSREILERSLGRGVLDGLRKAVEANADRRFTRITPRMLARALQKVLDYWATKATPRKRVWDTDLLNPCVWATGADMRVCYTYLKGNSTLSTRDAENWVIAIYLGMIDNHTKANEWLRHRQ